MKAGLSLQKKKNKSRVKRIYKYITMKIEFNTIGLIIIALFLLVLLGKATLWTVAGVILMMNGKTIIEEIKKLLIK
jgi:hypothetical protein